MAAEEMWKSIEGYLGYQVSNKGRIRSSKQGYLRILKTRSENKYERIKLLNKGQSRSYSVHRLVLEAFVGPCPLDHETNHKDGYKSNNSVENLEWATSSENLLHAYKFGLRCSVPVGEKTSQAKLKDGEVWLIKKLLAGGIHQNKIAKMFKMSTGAISSIALGWTWRHITA